jgi:hypothetical protein
MSLPQLLDLRLTLLWNEATCLCIADDVLGRELGSLRDALLRYKESLSEQAAPLQRTWIGEESVLMALENFATIIS